MSRRRPIHASYLGIFVIILLVMLNGFIQSDIENSAVEWQQPVQAKDIRRFELLNRTAVQVAQSYIDPKSIDPKKMFMSAISRLETEMPQFVLRVGDDDVPTAFQLGQFHQSIDDARFTSIWQTVFLISDALRMLARSGQVHEARLRQLERVACLGLLSTLDQHSVVLTDGDLFELKQNTLGRFGGIGVVIELEKAQLKVRDVMLGTPAHQAGIRRGQIIAEIDEDTTENISLNEAAELLRGPIGSAVTLGVRNRNASSVRRLRMMREKIKVSSVTNFRLKGDIAHLKIEHFQEQTAKEIKRLYEKWRRKPRGVIVDLRGNPGGLLDQAIEASDLFLSEGEIVTTVGHKYEPTHTHFATKDALDLDTPIVVLIDESSASASEILAAALQENGRAIVLGRPSYGKGTVQVLFEFPNETGLKLTVAQYLTPERKSIQDIGVQPNVVLRGFAPRKRTTVASATQFIKKTPAQHQFSIDFLSTDTDNDTEVEIAHQFLLEHMKQASINGRTDAAEVVTKLKKDYSRALKYAFAQQNLEWQGERCEKPSPIDLTIVDTVSTAQEPNVWMPTVMVSNKGNDLSGSMILVIRSGEHTQYLHTGGLNAGEQKTIQVKDPIPIDRHSQKCFVDFSLMDGCGRIRAQSDQLTSCRRADAPSVRSLIQFSDDRDGNKDGVFQVGERAQLVLSLVSKNMKSGARLHAYLTLMGKPRQRSVRLLRGRRTTQNRASNDPNGGSLSQLASVVFDLEAKKNQGLSQSVSQSMQLIVRDDAGKILLKQRFQVPVYPSEPIATLERDRMLTHSEPTLNLTHSTPLYFQPNVQSQLLAKASGRFRSIARRGQWHLIALHKGFSWAKANHLVQARASLDNSDPEQIIDLNFVQPSKIEFGVYDEFSTREDFTFRGRLLGENLLDYRLFHNGRKKAYRRLDMDPVTPHVFSQAIHLHSGLNRLKVVVRSTTGHETSKTLLVTKK